MKKPAAGENLRYLMSVTGISTQDIAAYINKTGENNENVLRKVRRWVSGSLKDLKPEKFYFLLDLFGLESIEDLRLEPTKFKAKYDSAKLKRIDNQPPATTSTVSREIGSLFENKPLRADVLVARIIESLRLRQPQIFAGLSEDDLIAISRIVANMPKATDQKVIDAIIDYRATLNRLRVLLATRHSEIIKEMAAHLHGLQ